MSGALILDSFLETPPESPQIEALPDDLESVRQELYPSAIKPSEIKKFLRKEASKLNVSATNSSRVLDADSLESFRQTILKLQKHCDKDAKEETLNQFLELYPFFADFEELKALLITFFSGRIEQKDHLFRALHQKIKKTEQSIQWILHPETKRDPIRTQVEHWLALYQKDQLKTDTFYPEGLSPYRLVDYFYNFQQSEAKREIDEYLKAFYASSIRAKKIQLQKSGLGEIPFQKEIKKFKTDLEKKKKEHYFTYGEIKKLDFIKRRLSEEMEKMVEYLSRKFILALPNDIIGTQEKEFLEKSTHHGQFEEIGQDNNLERHQKLLKQYESLNNKELITRLAEYKENVAIFNNSQGLVPLIQNLAKATKTSVTAEQIKQNSEKLLKQLLLKVARKSLKLRSFRYRLEKFMEKHQNLPIFPPGIAYDYGGLIFNLANLVVDFLFNPYQEFYLQLQRVMITDWCVFQLGEHDRLAGSNQLSQIKVEVYQKIGIDIFDKQGKNRNDQFYEAMGDKNRCHMTGTRNLETNSLELLPFPRFCTVFRSIRNTVLKQGDSLKIRKEIRCFGHQEELLGVLQDFCNLGTQQNHSEVWEAHPQQQKFPSIAESLNQLAQVLENQHQWQQAHRVLLESKYAELQKVNPAVSEVGELVAEVENSEPAPPEPLGDKLHTFKPEAPSFRNTPATTNRQASPLIPQHEELERYHFLSKNINYYPSFTEVSKLLLDYYEDRKIGCDATYTHDEKFSGNIEFQEEVIYFQVDEDHVIAIGKTYLFYDPTLPGQELSHYVRFFVRNKLYPNVPKEKGMGVFKNMLGLQTNQKLNMFEEIVLGQFKNTPEVNFKSLFKSNLLKVVQSLPADQQEHPDVKTFIEYLLPNKEIAPPIGPKLMMRIKESQLEDLLVIKQPHELLQDRVLASTKKVYDRLKKANAPILKARKQRLIAEKVPFNLQQIIIAKIQSDDKIRLYTMAIIFDIFLRLKKQIPDFDENGLYAIAGHFYGYKPGGLPEGIRYMLSAHLPLFKKK